MRIWRSSLYQDATTFPPQTLSARECDLSTPLEEAIKTKPIPGSLVIDDVIEVDHDVDEVEASFLVLKRLQERQQRELNMAMLYHWDGAQLSRVTPGGMLTATLPAPLSVSEITTVLQQLKHHPNWKGQTVFVISEDGVMVLMKPNGDVEGSQP